ncbi:MULTISPECIES: hypothetical protein [Micromonospora]|uniref:MYXO-CTERM domain-containing protein n=1 Tax=Micromonospora gifhornensis TaxID=84594 RepID=A0ABQ4IHX6_9ACTN|nr:MULTISPECIES: hypothetical protein [Micromonospora]PMR58301.1 hypothetical protein C1A38_25280 [Verrucosispora sp. ts21]GIJ17509.1 hypothetical protein Vgi01_41930 [Micromonospora gifhornensis]
MSAWDKWRGRLGVVLGAVGLSVFMPVAAWASSGSGEIVVRAGQNARPAKAGFSGLDCCLAVLFGIGLLVVLLIKLSRNRPSD